MCKTGVHLFFLSCFFALFCIEIFLMPTCLLAETGSSSGWSWESQTTMAYVSWISAVLTGGGLVASCWAAVRATNSAKAAKSAKEETLKLTSAFTGLANTWKLGNAIKEIDRIKEVNCSEGKYGVHYLYGILCDNIVEYRSSCRHLLSSENSTKIQEIVVFLRSLEGMFSPTNKNLSEIDIQEVNERLSLYKDVINEMTHMIGNHIMEKNNDC